MRFEDFLEMYDNWNGIVVVNNDNLECIARGQGMRIYENHKELYERKVVAFGFYDNELCIRIQ